MRWRVVVVLSVALGCFLAAACGGKKAGTSCKGTESTCADKNAALACRGGTFVSVPCGGPLACSKYQEHANCDTSLAIPGQACMAEDDEYACSPDKKRALVCNKAGKFEPWLECRGPAGCSMAGRSPTCDTSIAEKGDPCKTQGATSCSVDQKHLLICKGGRFDIHRYCRGQNGCAMKGESPSCDESLSLAGDPCGVPGQVVCSLDGQNELVCQGGVYFTSRPCRTGCTVTSRAGRTIDCR